MKTIQMPMVLDRSEIIGKSYEVSVQQTLSSPSVSGAYLQVALGESRGEPELLQSFLQNASIV